MLDSFILDYSFKIVVHLQVANFHSVNVRIR